METNNNNNTKQSHSKSYFQHEKGFTSKFITFLTSSEVKVKEYCSNVQQKSDLVITSNNTDAQSEQKEIKNLIQNLKYIQSEIGILPDGSKDSKTGISSTKLHIRDKQEALDEEKNRTRNEISQCEKELYFSTEKERESLSKAEEVRAAKRRAEENKSIDTNDLTLGMSYYKKLGLEFCKVDASSSRMSFTNFDSNDKHRTASFILAFVDGEIEVNDCLPSLRATTLSTLVEYLNDDYQNNLPTFLLKIRKAFYAEGNMS